MFAGRRVILRRVGRAAFRVHDHLPLVEEVIGHTDRGVEKTAGVAAKIEHELLHPLLTKLVDRVVKLADRCGGEVFDADVADAGTQHQRVGDRVGRDRCTNDCQWDRFLDAHSHDLDVNGGPFRAFQALDDIVERKVIGRDAFDFRDDIAGADAEPRGGSAFERSDDSDLIVALGQ